MLIGIIADLHANLEASRAVFKQLDAIGPDMIVCLGDLAGYCANPNEVIDMVRERQIQSVMGNHDAAACGLEEPWFFRAAAREALRYHIDIIRDDNKQFLAKSQPTIAFNQVCLGVHGAPGNRDDYIVDWLDAMRQLEFLQGTPTKICFFGHSHRASFFSEKGVLPKPGTSKRFTLNAQNRYFINPGAVGQPRDRDPRAAFGLLYTDTSEFEFHRVEYDIETAQQKILEAGLPDTLARRLALGK